MPAVPPPLFALGAGVIQRAVAPEGTTGIVRRTAAVVLGAASVGVAGTTVAGFRRNHTTVEPFVPSQASALVTDGPNAVTRNPMYLGMAGLLAAHALWRGGWRTALPVAGFVAVIDRVQVRPEEEALRGVFGEEYAAYCRRVPRWLGLPH
jgi:protein-S-isoprenylcysteine O-methyltransferase Ste14